MEKSKIKKILLIVAFIIFVVLIAYLIWITFFKTKPETGIISPGNEIGSNLPGSEDIGKLPGSETGNELPGSETATSGIQTEPQKPSSGDQGVSPIAVGGITQTDVLVSEKVSGQTLSQDGNSVQYYNTKDGKFYIIDENGNKIPLSDKVFYNVQNVEWAPNKTIAVIEYPDDTKIVYNFSAEKQYTLPSHWEDFSFSPDSEKIVSKSLGDDDDNRWLIVSNNNGSESSAIEYIGNNDNTVVSSWSPNNQVVAMYTKGVDFDTREVFFVGQNNENYKSTKVEGWGFEGQWSKTGDKLLYSVYNPKNELKPQLWIVNSQGDDIGTNRTNLQLQTWSTKCAFADNSTIYCAVPISLKPGSGLYPELADETSDILYKIDANNGLKELIAVPNGVYNISSLSISSNQENLFFTDKISGKLYKIKLK